MKLTTREYLKEYLDIKDIANLKDKEIVKVDNSTTHEEFLKALMCFNNLLESTTYLKNGVILCIYNNYILTFNYQFDDIKSLYDYAKKNNLFNICKYLSDFLTTFQFSLESDMYKNNENYSKISETFYENFTRKEFYGDGEYLLECLDYYIDFIENKKIIYDYQCH